MIEIALKILGLFLLSSTIVYALLKYMSQKLFENYLTKSLENYKSQLEKEVISHQIQFSSLHKDRADATRDIYINVNKLDFEIGRFITSLNEKQLGGITLSNHEIHLQHLGQIVETYNFINELISTKDIYFTSEFIINIRKYFNLFAQNVLEIMGKITDNSTKLVDDSFLDPQFFKQKNDLLELQIFEIKELLRAEFRILIGVK